jgi:serine/threonine protein kinase
MLLTRPWGLHKEREHPPTPSTAVSSSALGMKKQTATTPHPLLLDTSHVQASQSLTRFFGLDFTFDQLYETDQRLRSGSFGTVYTCRPRLQPTATYAVKILHRHLLTDKDDQAVFREVAILRLLRHQSHVIQLIDFIVQPDQLYVILEYASGGDVWDRLTHRSVYTEKDARDLARTLLDSVQALHTCQPHAICHRDLKPENLLLRSMHDDTSIVVADFGFARPVPAQGLQTRCGTPAFVAPEILLGMNYYTSIDLWSVGCILYM